MNDQIIFLIARKLNRQASNGELEQLQNWINSAPGNLEEYEIFVKIWKESKTTIESYPFDTNAAWSKVDPLSISSTRHGQRRIPLTLFKRLAAAASVVIIAGVGSYLLLKPQRSILFVEAATNQPVTLPDGSIVTLRKGSSIQYSQVFNAGSRIVQLHGEAFFQVVHNQKQPFRVLTGKAEVNVTGTSFLVRSSDSTEEVMVESGKVKVTDKEKNGGEVTLLAGEKVVLQRNHFKQAPLTDSNYLAWKTGVLDFHNASMLKVLEDIGHYYTVPISANNKHLADIAKISITVRFEHQPLEQVLDELTLITGLIVKKEHDTIIFDEK